VKQNRRVDDGNLLSSEQVYWESILATLNLFISLAPLVHDDVNDLVLLTDILSGDGHKLIDDLVEQFGVAAGVISYPQYQLGHSFFVLF
jgi:hypothetical protein